MIKTLPEELEKYIIKNYFHYHDVHYLSPVCKKWRDINNYITELKIFLKYVFETCLIYPLQIPYQIGIITNLPKKNLIGK